MEVSAHIDWISLTMRGVTYSRASAKALERIARFGLHKDLSEMKWADAKGHNGYTVGLLSETGILMMSNPERADMGTHVVMSGKTLANTAIYGVKPEEILRWATEAQFRLSRVDYAVDAKGSGLEISELANAIEAKEHKSRARSAPYIDDKLGKGKTQYVGSMKNRTKLFRAYEKDVQSGAGGDWKRFELELHGQHANNSARMLADSQNLAQTIQGLIKGFIDFPDNEIWQKIMQSDEIWLSVPEVQQGNTEAWLINQVAPALAKVLDLDESFMHTFMLAVQENRKDVE